MDFANNITALRLQKKISKRAMAQMIGVTPATYGGYESGDKVPTLETAAKIADALGVSLDWLAGRKARYDGKIETWGDILRSISKLIVSLDGFAFPRNLNTLIYENDDGVSHLYVESDENIPSEGEDEKTFSLVFYNSPLLEIAAPMSRLIELLAEEEIDKEVFDAWIEKRACDLDAKKVGGKESAPQE